METVQGHPATIPVCKGDVIRLKDEWYGYTDDFAVYEGRANWLWLLRDATGKRQAIDGHRVVGIEKVVDKAEWLKANDLSVAASGSGLV
jgi:hypothetical protein